LSLLAAAAYRRLISQIGRGINQSHVAKYLGQKSFYSQVMVLYTEKQTNKHINTRIHINKHTQQTACITRK